MSARFIVADVFDGLATLDDASVDLVITSPPFLALRSYLPADHPDKSREIGSEATPAAFIDVMLAVTAELRRVLAPHGSICVELGDTYAGSGGAGGDYLDGGMRQGQNGYTGSARRDRVPVPRQWSGGYGWPLPKSKTMIPELYRVALAYGRNPLRSPLTARELVDWFERIVADMSASGNEPPATDLLRMMSDYIDQRAEFGPYREYEPWRVRNVVTWARPNPPVGALGDKFRPATSDVVIACVSDKRYWDDIATRREHQSLNTQKVHWQTDGEERAGNNSFDVERYSQANAHGAPLLDYWEIPPGGFKGSHYAVFPPALVEPLVKAMAPPKVCRTCGEPSRRITSAARTEGKPPVPYDQINKLGGPWRAEVETTYTTTGWTDCGHDNFRPAHILDPFAGSGTTGVVATGHGYDVTLIDLDERNRDLARERIGPLMWEQV